MSIASAAESGKVDSRDRGAGSGSRWALAAGISAFVLQAAPNGTGPREFERNLFDRLLEVGRAATEQCLGLQGNGDLGETTLAEDGRTLVRSTAPVERPLRTVFGKHMIRAYVYRQPGDIRIRRSCCGRWISDWGSSPIGSRRCSRSSRCCSCLEQAFAARRHDV